MISSPAPPPTAPLHAGRPVILVVEDELLVRMLTSELLREEGYNVVEAFNADEALSILKTGVQIDLVISDVRMPGSLDGLGLLTLVRETHPDLPVIITSGHLQPDTAFVGESTQFLPKPFSVAQAIMMVERGLEQRQ